MNSAADDSGILTASEWQAFLRQLEHAARWQLPSRRLSQLGNSEPVPISLGDLRSLRHYSVVPRPAVVATDNAYWPRAANRASALRPAPGAKAASLRVRKHTVILYDVRGLAAASLEAAVSEVEHDQVERMDFVPVFVTDCLEFQCFISRGYVFEYMPASPIGEAPASDSRDWATERIEWLSAKWGAAAVLAWGRKQMRAQAGAEAKVFVYPDYRSSNPYQQLMYRQDRSFAVHYADIAKAAMHAANGGTAIFHLHWRTPRPALSPARQSKARERFLFTGGFRQFKELGGVFIWTMHNLVPHDGVDPKKAVAFNRQVAALADIIHFHSRSAADRALLKFGIDSSRIRIIEHPSYEGAYPSAQPSDGVQTLRAQCWRFRAPVFWNDKAVQKNLEALLEAVEDLPPRVRVVITGARAAIPSRRNRIEITVLDRPISAQEASDLLWDGRFRCCSDGRHNNLFVTSCWL